MQPYNMSKSESLATRTVCFVLHGAQYSMLYNIFKLTKQQDTVNQNQYHANDGTKQRQHLVGLQSDLDVTE